MARIAALILALVAAAMLAGGVASAQAATYHVATGGVDTGDCTVDACATIQYALDQHRETPGPDDIVQVGPGTFVGNVAATDPLDDGLTIRGTLDSGGGRKTLIRGEGVGTSDCMYPQCAVSLGMPGGGTDVSLEDTRVDTANTDGFLVPVSIEGGADLRNVHARGRSDVFVPAIVALCSDPGTVIEDSVIDARNSGNPALDTGAGVVVRDSQIRAGDAPAVTQFNAFPGDSIELVRTRVLSAPDTANPVIISTSDLLLDSSLVTGGNIGAAFGPADGGTWEIRNSTIDVGDPGTRQDAMHSLEFLQPDDAQPLNVTVDSSILVEKVEQLTAPGYEGPGQVDCTYSDLPASTSPGPMVIDCDTGGSTTNTTSDPAELFVGGDPFSWRLEEGASAIDTGQPGAIGPGQSTTDLAGAPRRQPGTGPTCPDGVVDKGAYERGRVPCNTSLPTVTGTPELGQVLGSTVGVWETGNLAVRYHRQWARCDDTGANCDEIVGATGATYAPGEEDLGHTLRQTVVGSNAYGNSEVIESEPTAEVTLPVPVNRQPPSIIGIPQVGKRVSVSLGRWRTLGYPTSFSRQMYRCEPDGPACVPIPGATGVYRVTSDDVGHALVLEVIATNAGGSSLPARSARSPIITEPG